MRVAVVSPYDAGAPGGVQQHSAELVERLSARGHDAWLVAPGAPSSGRSLGRSTRVRGNAASSPISLGPSVFARVRAACAGADVVHVHEPLMPLASWAAIRLDAPRVVTFHADPPAWARRLYRIGERPLAGVMRRAVVTAVSPVARSAVPDRWGEVEIVTNGIDVDSYRVEADRREDLVVFLGRDDPRKGLDVLLRAWPLVQGRHRGAELVVAGATRGSNTDGVRFVGRVSEAEKRRLLGTATVFVAPNTRGESFGIVVAEAMAAGAPVVASDIPAFRWVAGECGVLVPVEDAASVAESVSALLADPERRSGLSAAALRRVGRFDWGTVVALYEAAYRRARDMTM